MELDTCLINLASNYYINNYQNLIRGIESKDKKVNFYLLVFFLFFLIEAEIDRIQKVQLSGT